MPKYLVKLNIMGKDGVTREETIVSDRSEPGAIELPEGSSDFMTWDGTKFMIDEANKAKHLEDARLRRMTPSERHEEAIQQAEARIAAKLKKKGIDVG